MKDGLSFHNHITLDIPIAVKTANSDLSCDIAPLSKNKNAVRLNISKNLSITIDCSLKTKCARTRYILAYIGTAILLIAQRSLPSI